MTKKTFGATLLFAVINISLPLHAEQGSVALKVCNAGKVAIDVFLSQSSKVSSAHIGTADCAVVAHSEGAMSAAYLGLAFASAGGEWGAARRQDFLPDLGPGVLTRASQSVSVRHGGTTVSLPMQLLFQPRAPVCSSPQAYSAQARLPLGATPAQVAEARRQDETASAMASENPTCDAQVYVLNVFAYPDSREITFKNFCEPCDKKAEARLTPEERAARQRKSDATNQMIGSLQSTGPLAGILMGNVVKQADQAQLEEQRARQKELDVPQRVSWKDLRLFVHLAEVHAYTKEPMNTKAIIQGTVSKVDLPLPGASRRAVDIYFKEASDFNVCTKAEILQDLFGPDFSTRMIGKTLEVEGDVGDYCKSGAGIPVMLSRQLHMVGSAHASTTAPAWVPPNRSNVPQGRPE